MPQGYVHVEDGAVGGDGEVGWDVDDGVGEAGAGGRHCEGWVGRESGEMRGGWGESEWGGE